MKAKDLLLSKELQEDFDDEPVINDSISSMIYGMDGQTGQLAANSRAILPQAIPEKTSFSYDLSKESKELLR